MNSSESTEDCRRNNIGVLHLAGEVSQMQSKMSSAASKLLQSADMVTHFRLLSFLNWLNFLELLQGYVQ